MNILRKTAIAFGLLFALCASGVAAQGNATASRLQKAEALFQERCKTAGEKIHKTVDNVEGIFLMKLRPSKINYQDQFELDDPYGNDLVGQGYLASFVKGQYQATHTGTRAPGSPPRIGYRYVEALDPADGKRYRYTGRVDEPWRYDDSYSKHYKRFVLDKTPAAGPQPRYGVTYDDISTQEDRQYWIAGSSLKVIDLKTKEVIAERIGYMMDRGQGGTSGGRSPWLMATENSCPSFRAGFVLKNAPAPAGQRYQTLDFVEKVLKPKQGN